MSRHPTAGKGLDLAKIVSAALDELDAVGLDEISLRGVARRLGVQAPALYWHVSSKRALLEQIATELWRRPVAAATIGECDALPVWSDLLRAYMLELRASLTSRRDGARAASSAVILDSQLLRDIEPTLARFATAGVSADDIVTLFQTAQHATVGFCINEQHRAAEPVDLDERARRLKDSPFVGAMGDAVLGNADARFAATIELLIAAGHSTVGRLPNNVLPVDRGDA
ncbi:TetR/AcrR family transcriptional regulator C-terminal domain-containing protein [Williamsia sp.]|uniref:TetR family transcriptional regulator n=1 Tax=Williamsia sp. TaxID=1872085 RepID=UPI001A23F261|nr:TetR/AcrR family transcriptional regulator C-terminal domain-containing protein [Williamsia sp.]MBJ7291655.1 TetR/AcrR family transcriptional regulator C-terminal domain-containing protein [Williamsia sp.]